MARKITTHALTEEELALANHRAMSLLPIPPILSTAVSGLPKFTFELKADRKRMGVVNGYMLDHDGDVVADRPGQTGVLGEWPFEWMGDTYVLDVTAGKHPAKAPAAAATPSGAAPATSEPAKPAKPKKPKKARGAAAAAPQGVSPKWQRPEPSAVTAYVLAEGAQCPYCSGTTQRSEIKTDARAGVVLIPVECTKCHRTWCDRLRLVGIEPQSPVVSRDKG